MSEYCVVVAGGAKARIFSLEPAELPQMESGPNLVEQASLSNPQHQAHDAEIYSDLRRGRNRAAFGPAHGYDDHRDGHEKEVDRKFARDVAARIGRLLSTNGYQHLVLCADARMLGMLRPSLAGLTGIELHEVNKDLAKLNTRELHDRLADEGHLPRRRARRA